MKTSSNQRFTLIELLVVIAIICILAGLIFPAIGTVRNNAKKSKASSECQALKAAIIMYESEFSCWPGKITEKGNDGVIEISGETSQNDNYAELCKILSGSNAKKMVFFDPGSGYNEKIGVLDPWGCKYRIILDANFDDKIEESADSAIKVVNGSNNRSGQAIRSRVAVSSVGVPEADDEYPGKDNNEAKLKKLNAKKKLIISW